MDEALKSHLNMACIRDIYFIVVHRCMPYSSKINVYSDVFGDNA